MPRREDSPPVPAAARSTPPGSTLSRRGFLGAGLAAAGAAATPWSVAAQTPTPPGSVRVAHLTDVHLRADLDAERGLATCLERVQSLRTPPDAIVFGGDQVHEARNMSIAEATRLYRVLQRRLRDVKLPVYWCLGNHDMLGWHGEAVVDASHELAGPGLFQQLFEMPSIHHGFDLGRWRVIVVNDVLHAPEAGGYVGGLDEEAQAFLERELTGGDGDRPVLMVTHIPILSVTGYSRGDFTDAEAITIPKPLVCRDPRAILDRIGPARFHAEAAGARHLPADERRQVRVVLAGHLHQNERIDYEGVTHVMSGAVSGGWWSGANGGHEEGFNLVTLHPDGAFEMAYVVYDWTGPRG